VNPETITALGDPSLNSSITHDRGYHYFADGTDGKAEILPGDEFWFEQARRWTLTSRHGFLGTAGYVYRRKIADGLDIVPIYSVFDFAVR